jgi:hypothetical protein
VLTQDNSYAVLPEAGWESHAQFEKDTGITGVHIIVDQNTVLINDEAVALPELYSWIYPDNVADLEIEQRRRIVEQFVQSCAQAESICPPGCRFAWYS